MNRFVRVAAVPNISALAWELVETYPNGAHLFCLSQDFAEELREEIAVFAKLPVRLLPAHDIDSQTQRRPALYERKERLRFFNGLKQSEAAYFLWTVPALLEKSLSGVLQHWET